MSLAVVSLIVLAVFGALAGLVLARVFGTAAARNENTPGDGGESSESEQEPPSDEDIRRQKEEVKQIGPLFGAATAVLGILLGLAGAVIATRAVGDTAFSSTIPMISVAAVLGIVGYYLGARKLGRVAVILAAITLIFGIAASQGVVPGLGPTDQNLPAQEPRATGQ